MHKRSFVLQSILIALALQCGNAQAQAVFSSNSGFLSFPTNDGNNSFDAGSDGSANPQTSDGSASPLTPKFSKKARRVRFSPYAGASVTYSDNVNLAPEDGSIEKEDGLIYNANVGLNAAYQSQRLDAFAGVSLGYIRRDNGTDDVTPAANLGFSTELVSNLLYLDAVGGVSGLRPNARAANSLSGATNSEYDIFYQGSISPYIRRQFSSLLVGELRYGYDYGSGSADTIGTIQSHSYSASLGTSDLAGRLNLNGSLSYSDISFDNEDINSNINLTQDNDSTQLTGEVTASYAITKKLSALAQVGYDDVETSEVERSDELSGEFYNVGLEYVPNSRLRLTGRVGERHNTLYYAVDGNYNLTKKVFIGATAMTQLMTALPLGFSNNIVPGTAFDRVTEGETLASSLNQTLPGGNLSRNDGQTFLGNQQNRQLFISRGINAFMGFNLRDGSFGVALGYEERDYDRATDETLSSATANYRHNFNRNISGTVEAFYSDLDGLVENSNQSYGVRLLGNYAVNNNLNLFASIGFNQRQADISQFEFTEHSVSAGVSTQF